MHDEIRAQLPSWRDGAAVEAVVDGIASIVDPSSSSFVPEVERIATFDNDGTLWCERPIIAQAAFLMQRWTDMAEADPSMRTTDPYRLAVEGDVDAFAAEFGHGPAIVAGLSEAYAGETPQAVDDAVRAFIASYRHLRFDRPLTDLSFVPMVELFHALEANGFTTYVASAGGRDFLRVFAGDLYGVPRHRVIGTSTTLTWTDRRLVRGDTRVDPVDEGPGKPVHIYERTGLLPSFAAGNANGDVEMLESARVSVLLRHDDANREYAYDDSADRARAGAAELGWVVVSMRDDFARVFAHEG
jgi:phosphoglycolate phosphatase-like HAD superfamily hydrolase